MTGATTRISIINTSFGAIFLYEALSVSAVCPLRPDCATPIATSGAILHLSHGEKLSKVLTKLRVEEN